MDALVIVHLSSLDAYAEHAGLAAANELSRRLQARILEFPGAVYIIDQRWPLGEFSGPRYNLVLEVELKRAIKFVHFNDRREDWGDFLVKFRAQLLRDGIRDVVLGGVWYHPDGESGCVSEAGKLLKRNLRVRVDPDLVACLS